MAAAARERDFGRAAHYYVEKYNIGHVNATPDVIAAPRASRAAMSGWRPAMLTWMRGRCRCKRFKTTYFDAMLCRGDYDVHAAHALRRSSAATAQPLPAGR